VLKEMERRGGVHLARGRVVVVDERVLAAVAGSSAGL